MSASVPDAELTVGPEQEQDHEACNARIGQLEVELATMAASRQEGWSNFDDARRTIDAKDAEIARLKGQIDGLLAATKAGVRNIARAADQFFDSLEARLRAEGIPVDTRPQSSRG